MTVELMSDESYVACLAMTQGLIENGKNPQCVACGSSDDLRPGFAHMQSDGELPKEFVAIVCPKHFEDRPEH